MEQFRKDIAALPHSITPELANLRLATSRSSTSVCLWPRSQLVLVDAAVPNVRKTSSMSPRDLLAVAPDRLPSC